MSGYTKDSDKLYFKDEVLQLAPVSGQPTSSFGQGTIVDWNLDLGNNQELLEVNPEFYGVGTANTSCTVSGMGSFADWRLETAGSGAEIVSANGQTHALAQSAFVYDFNKIASNSIGDWRCVDAINQANATETDLSSVTVNTVGPGNLFIPSGLSGRLRLRCEGRNGVIYDDNGGAGMSSLAGARVNAKIRTYTKPQDRETVVYPRIRQFQFNQTLTAGSTSDLIVNCHDDLLAIMIYAEASGKRNTNNLESLDGPTASLEVIDSNGGRLFNAPLSELRYQESSHTNLPVYVHSFHPPSTWGDMIHHNRVNTLTFKLTSGALVSNAEITVACVVQNQVCPRGNNDYDVKSVA
jgi:hypothetical protein